MIGGNFCQLIGSEQHQVDPDPGSCPVENGSTDHDEFAVRKIERATQHGIHATSFRNDPTGLRNCGSDRDGVTILLVEPGDAVDLFGSVKGILEDRAHHGLEVFQGVLAAIVFFQFFTGLGSAGDLDRDSLLPGQQLLEVLDAVSHPVN